MFTFTASLEQEAVVVQPRRIIRIAPSGGSALKMRAPAPSGGTIHIPKGGNVGASIRSRMSWRRHLKRSRSLRAITFWSCHKTAFAVPSLRGIARKVLAKESSRANEDKNFRSLGVSLYWPLGSPREIWCLSVNGSATEALEGDVGDGGYRRRLPTLESPQNQIPSLARSGTRAGNAKNYALKRADQAR